MKTYQLIKNKNFITTNLDERYDFMSYNLKYEYYDFKRIEKTKKKKLENIHKSDT